MDFQHDLHRTRSALAEIERAFPLEAEDLPRGIEALFQFIEQMEPETLLPWSEHLLDKDLDLLCQFAHRAPSSRAHLALALILGKRADIRAQKSLRYFIHQNPSSGERMVLAKYWLPLNFPKICAALLPWLDPMVRQCPEHLVPYLNNELLANELSFEDLCHGFDHLTPLTQQLIDSLFDHAADNQLIQKIPAPTAVAAAEVYLRKEHHQRLANYFSFYPESRWPAEFLALLHAYYGPPDPANHAFYRSLQAGRLWAIRRQMFSVRIVESPFDRQRQNFWIEWAHRCQNWVWLNSHARVDIHPLRVIEQTSRSQVFLVEGEPRPIAVIEAGFEWRQKMNELLQKYSTYN